MIDIFLRVLICGIATAAICRTLVYYNGPFNIIPRFKDSLLPKGSGILNSSWSIKTYDELKDNWTDVLMADQESDGKWELWKVYHTTYNREFYQSFRGTIYGVLDCVFCLGPYVSVVMAAISLPETLSSWLLVSCGSYGIHFLISKWWES